MKRALAIAFVAAVSLAPACKMQEQKPQNTNLNKAPIVETIRDAGVRMTDDREKLAIVPKKIEEKAAEKADAGAVPAPQPKAKHPGQNKQLERNVIDESLFGSGYALSKGPPDRVLEGSKKKLDEIMKREPQPSPLSPEQKVADAGVASTPQPKAAPSKKKKIELLPCPPPEFPNGGYLMPKGPPDRPLTKRQQIH